MRALYLLLLSILTYTSVAQEENDVESALKVFHKDKEKGIAKMEKTMVNSTNSKYWDVLVKMYYESFLESGSDRSSTNRKYDNFINTCRRSTQFSRSPLGSMYLRTYCSENDPDSLVAKASKDLVVKANTFINEKNFEAALQSYKNAVKSSPAYFNAFMQMGDCYRMMKMPDSAISAYKQAISISANHVDAWTGLVHAMIDKSDFVFVIDAATTGLTVYPDEELFNLYYYIQNKQKKTFNRYWFPRRYTINSFKYENEPVEEIPWKIYREAKEEIKPFCNKDGIIILENNLTKAKYMEVYAWEKMLKRPECTRMANFDFPRRMQTAGYLDCFVLFSMFHNDFYEQFKHFSQNNKKKLTKYIETYLLVK